MGSSGQTTWDTSLRLFIVFLLEQSMQLPIISCCMDERMSGIHVREEELKGVL